MSRYIDADALKEHIEVITYEGMWHESETDEFVSVENIDSAPSIDIVRCAECKYNYGIAHNCGFNDEDIVCTYWESDGLTNIDFCSYGERNDDA